MNGIRLAEREKIRDVLRRYCRGVDRKDWDLVRTAFHPDAYDDHGPYKGGVDGFVDMVQRRHAAIGQSTHMVTDSFIEFFGDADALVESPFLVFQTVNMIGSDRTEEHDAIGRYVDHFCVVDGEWRIQQRTVVIEKYRVAAMEAARQIPSGWIAARRDGNDVVETERRRLSTNLRAKCKQV